MLKNMRRAAVISATVALVGISVAPAAHAAKAPQPDLVWYLGSPDRSVVDLPPTGPSLGDITVTNGDVSELPGKISIGFYSTNQTTVRVNIPGGREIRDVDLAISAPGGVIYATALIRANSGTPPTKAQTLRSSAVRASTREFPARPSTAASRLRVPRSSTSSSTSRCLAGLTRDSHG